MKRKLLLSILAFLPFFANGQIIKLTNDHAEIDTIFAREDLERDQQKDFIIQYLNQSTDTLSEIVQHLNQELKSKDWQIEDLQRRYLEMSNMVVQTEKERKKERFGRKVFQYAFVGMTFVAFILGVK